MRSTYRSHKPQRPADRSSKPAARPAPTRTQMDVFLGKAEKPLGRLIFVKDGQREFSQFAYSDDWLSDAQFFDVSPDLNRQSGYQLRKPPTKNDTCFFLALADTEPDAWGRRVIARAHAKARAKDASLGPLTEADYLACVDDFSRVGALRLRDESGHYLPIIERNSIVPVSRVKTVYTLHDNQEQVVVRIFQGESRLVKDNVALGELDIKVPKRKAGEVALDVRFTYDNNGLLEAQVKIPLTGQQHSLVIENNPGVLSPEEIQQRLQNLAQLKIHPREQQVNTLLTARLERLYQESLGDMRDLMGDWAKQFQIALDSQDERQIREVRTDLSRRLSELDRTPWQ